MDEKEQDNVAAFDVLFTSNQIQIMKILLPCFAPSTQKYLAIYIKYQELQYTISYFHEHSVHASSLSSNKSESFLKLLPALLPYCTDSQKKMIQQFEQMLSSMETYREMMEMMQTMQSMAGTENSDAPFDMSGGQMPDMELLMSLLGPEQQNFMEMMKGGTPHEGTSMDE